MKTCVFYKCLKDGSMFSSERGVKLHLLYKFGIKGEEAEKYIQKITMHDHWLFSDVLTEV